MTQSRTENRQMTLAARPVGTPGAEHFALKTTPVSSIVEGQLLLRTVYLSLDPYMRGRMSDADSYADPVAIGGVMVGGTNNRVVENVTYNLYGSDPVETVEEIAMRQRTRRYLNQGGRRR